LEEAVTKAGEMSPFPLVLLLDGVSDVRNFGAIARTAECAGVGALILPAKGGAAVNQESIRTSAGALLRIPTSRVPQLENGAFLLERRRIHYNRYGCKRRHTLVRSFFQKTGSAHFGVGRGRHITECQEPMRSFGGHSSMGEIGSLNVSAAAAVVLFEAVRQKSEQI